MTFSGGELIDWCSGKPLYSIAEASTNSLNVEPAWKPFESPYSCGTM